MSYRVIYKVYRHFDEKTITHLADSLEFESDIDVTDLLRRWRDGDRAAESLVISALFPKLHEIAEIQHRRFADQPLQITELVNELFLKLRVDKIEVTDRAHFFAIAARAVRFLLIDQLRKQQRDKRGAGVEVPFAVAHESAVINASDPTDWLQVDQALEALWCESEELGRLVELRVFGGQTIPEVATLTGVSSATVGRRWRFAKAWLQNRIELNDHI